MSTPQTKPTPNAKKSTRLPKGKPDGFIKIEFPTLRRSPDEQASVKIHGRLTRHSETKRLKFKIEDEEDEENENVENEMSKKKEPLAPALADLRIKWPKISNEKQLKFCLEVRVRIDTVGAWPFSSRRPFFILYRHEEGIHKWYAVYRSEVLTEPSPTRDADGAMVFQMFNVPLSDVIGDCEPRPLRLEFFHYRVSESDQPNLLAFMETSIVQLRQLEPGPMQPFILNIVARGELFGTLNLRESKITKDVYYFSIEANFGGPIGENLIYFDCSLVDKKHEKSNIPKRSSRLKSLIASTKSIRTLPALLSLSSSSNIYRPYFSIQRCSLPRGHGPHKQFDTRSNSNTLNNSNNSNNNNNNMMTTTTSGSPTSTLGTTTGTGVSGPKYEWEEVYKSESATRSIAQRIYNFHTVRISEQKLNESEEDRVISFNLHMSKNKEDSKPFAFFLTNIESLRICPLGAVFKLNPCGPDVDVEDSDAENSELGYARLNIKERQDTKMMFSFSFILGESAPPGSTPWEI